jgi:F-type H+-transporting ATPase subunit b
MAQTLHALGGIFVRAIPTILLLVFLHFYFKLMLFGPLKKVLKRREELTEGARKTADMSLAFADRKAAEYEAKLRDARAQVYRAQEETRKRWLEDQTAQVAEARKSNEEIVKQARYQIATEAAGARQTLLETSAALADEIASAVLARRADEFLAGGSGFMSRAES